MRRRRNPEVIAGRIAADGSITTGDGFTCQKGSTGTYVLTFPGLRLLSVTANPALNGAWGIYEYQWTANAVTLFAFTTGGAIAADIPIAFVAVGVQQ
jgi:hypothetical protein